MILTPHTRLIVMGTPPFILPTLYRMLEEKDASGEPQFDLVAVYTRAPKPAGHGLGLQYSAVHKAALEIQKSYCIPFEIVTPETFKNPDNVAKFQSFKPDLVIVGAYGLILPKAVLDASTMGCINLHASLLPYGRGAAPIQRAIWDGKDQTGLTIMKMDEGCDTGLILKQKAIDIHPTTTAEDLFSALAEMGPDLLMQTLRENPEGQKQDESQATYAKKILKEEAQIDWNKSAEFISRQIRALSPAPGAFTFIENEKKRCLRLKIYNALAMPQNFSGEKPGVVLENNGKIIVSCQEGSLELIDVQMEGKKRMTGAEFSRGNILKKGDQLLNSSTVLQNL